MDEIRFKLVTCLNCKNTSNYFAPVWLRKKIIFLLDFKKISEMCSEKIDKSYELQELYD